MDKETEKQTKIFEDRKIQKTFTQINPEKSKIFL
jgi:hypothetical protein